MVLAWKGILICKEDVTDLVALPKCGDLCVSTVLPCQVRRDHYDSVLWDPCWCK